MRKGMRKPEKPEQVPVTEKMREGLGETKRKEILAVVSVGCNRTTAAHYAGCTVADIREELGKNRRFAQELARAEEQSEVFFLEKIRKAAHKEQYWRAAAWALERRYPSRYASRGARSLSVEEVHEIVDSLALMVAEELPNENDRRRLLSRIRMLVQEKSKGKKGETILKTENNDDDV